MGDCFGTWPCKVLQSLDRISGYEPDGRDHRARMSGLSYCRSASRICAVCSRSESGTSTPPGPRARWVPGLPDQSPCLPAELRPNRHELPADARVAARPALGGRNRHYALQLAA